MAPTTRYRSLSGTTVDPSKHRYSADLSDDETVPALTSHHHQHNESFRPIFASDTAPSRFTPHLPRRRFTRYFTLTLGTILVVLVVYLYSSSAGTERAVRWSNKPAPAQPAAWETFPFLKRYHGGIRTLVRKEENVPEFPAADAEEELRRLKESAMEQKGREDGRLVGEKGFDKRDGDGKEGEKKGDGEEEGHSRKFLEMSERFDPYTSETSAEGFQKRVKCYIDKKEKTEIPGLLAYKGIPKGFAEPAYGSHKLLGLRDDVCFERYGRLGPYGFGFSRKFGGSGAGMDGENEGSEKVWDGQLEIDYRTVNWADVQKECMDANAHRFKPADEQLNHFFASAASGGPAKEHVSARDTSAEGDAKKEDDTSKTEYKADSPKEDSPKSTADKKHMPRSAVIIRTWWDYQYDAEDIFYLRALMNELSIQSGTEYVVHFLIHVKDDNKQIWADENVYQQVLNDSLPLEFRGMGTLWSERQMGLIYGGLHESNYRDLPVHGAYRSTYMPMQYFAHMHPEYDFFWHWEMDIRYTGHFYHLFSEVASWAKAQPRKELWERNGRFYVPSEHGSWEDFRQEVRVQTEHGTATKAALYGKLGQDAGSKHPLDAASRRPDAPVWGPLPPTGEGDTTDSPENDPQPPHTYEKDNYVWGVGEEADFITFNPLFDPHGTNWILAEDVTGYNTEKGHPPRRTAIITASRLSRKLLTTMHRETALQRHTMFSEMWPGSCALHHGYKAVYAPHPVYIDRAWPTSYLAAIFNNGRNGASGGARTAVFSDERQHNFRGTTWYYDAGFAPNLWKRWLGYKVDNDGGEEEEVAGEGRMCLPGMLLHPVKQVDLVYEHTHEDP